MPFDVFARWRPLPVSAEGEITRTHSPLPGEEAHATRISTSLMPPEHLSKTVRPWKSGAIFRQVFEATDTISNRTVFDAVVAPVLPRVWAGETTNFLAYGHSGSGKSHTMIGYDFQNEEQFGLCLAAGREVFQYLSSLSKDGEQLGVGISMYELRGNTAFDLLNRTGQSQDKVPCHIREGADGKTHIRGETETFADGRVRVRPITQNPCWTFDELRTTLLSGLELRTTGTSTIHDQSSRTHAVLELEIITKALLDARDAVIERQSELVPVAKRATDIYLEENMKAFIQDANGKYVPNPEYTIDQERIDKAEARKAEFEIAVNLAEDGVDAVFSSCRHACLGGKMVFVDLAGSEYYHDKSMSTPASPAVRAKQTPQEQREGRQINTDLLALKEVIRARALGQARIPYRSSPLTMVLRGHFESSSSSSSNTSEGSSSRNKGDSEGYTAMILTVSPAATQFAATMNTLKYGNLVGVGVQAAGESTGKR
ncbi:P-loop containing nucleoside triphosphate hydrolase protein [Aspergillus nidulans var. acristatus]